MKSLYLKIVGWGTLLTLLGGCASQKVTYTCPVPSVTSPTSLSSVALKNQLDEMIDRELLPYSLASIKVVSLRSGTTIYETKPHLLMPAASVQKLFTAAAVLSLLGPDHALETTISLDPDSSTLYLKGCGDPLLKTGDLTRLADKLAGILPPGRQYKLVGDTSCFDDAYWGSGWMWDDEPGPDAMFLSALSVNRNTVRVTVAAGKSASVPVQVSLEPSTRHVTIENSGITGKPGGGCMISVTRQAGDRDNRIRISGTLSAGCASVTRRLTVWRPELYTLTLLKEQLEKSGVSTGLPTLGVVPAGTQILASTRRPISDIISVMLKKSDNLCAENLFKYLAHVQSGQKGTAAGGEKAVKEYLRKNGIPTDRLVIADGSGMSRYNLTNAETIVRLLVAASKDQATYPLFAAALPLAGKDGTLVNRMKNTSAERKVKAKTGTMQGISALAGYTVTADGEPVAFAMIIENFVGSEQRARNFLDRIAVLLSRYPAISSNKADREIKPLVSLTEK